MSSALSLATVLPPIDTPRAEAPAPQRDRVAKDQARDDQTSFAAELDATNDQPKSKTKRASDSDAATAASAKPNAGASSDAPAPTPQAAPVIDPSIAVAAELERATDPAPLPPPAPAAPVAPEPTPEVLEIAGAASAAAAAAATAAPIENRDDEPPPDDEEIVEMDASDDGDAPGATVAAPPRVDPAAGQVPPPIAPVQSATTESAQAPVAAAQGGPVGAIQGQASPPGAAATSLQAVVAEAAAAEQAPQAANAPTDGTAQTAAGAAAPPGAAEKRAKEPAANAKSGRAADVEASAPKTHDAANAAQSTAKRDAEAPPQASAGRAETSSDQPPVHRAHAAEGAAPAGPDLAAPSLTPTHQAAPPLAATLDLSAPAATASPSPVVATAPVHLVPMTIGLQALEGAREFQIRLDPDDLGRVDVKLTISEDGRVAASLVVDRVETMSMLQRDARTLERAFDQAGLTADSESVTVSLRQDQSGQQRNGDNRDDAPFTPSNARRIDIETPVDASAMRAWRNAPAAAGVDIRV